MERVAYTAEHELVGERGVGTIREQIRAADPDRACNAVGFNCQPGCAFRVYVGFAGVILLGENRFLPGESSMASGES